MRLFSIRFGAAAIFAVLALLSFADFSFAYSGAGGIYSVNISAITELGSSGTGGNYSVRISQQQAPLNMSAGYGGGYNVQLRYIRVAYIDRAQPLVQIQLPQNATYKNTYMNLNYTITDMNLASCWYSLDSGANTTLDYCQNSTLLSLSVGSHTLRVYANNTDGNQNVSLAWFSVNTTAGNVTVSFSVHLGSSMADDSVQGNNNYACISDPNGWFGLASEAPKQTLYSNLTNDFNITVVQGTGSKIYIGASRGGCGRFSDKISSILAGTFLSSLQSFAYPATNLIQLILPFDSTDIAADAHWGKGTYLLSIANQGYNATSGKEILSVRVVK